MHRKNHHKKAQEAAAKKAEELNCSCLIQSGSSLRKEDFAPGSDLDLLALFDEKKEERWGHDCTGSLDISIMKESKTEFLDGLKNGNPFELMALKFGKIRKDDGFLNGLDRSKYSPTERTHEVWIRSGLNQYSKMLNNLFFPLDFYNAAYHSFRSFSRTILLREKDVLLEKDKMIIRSLKNINQKAADYFSSLRKYRFEVPDFKEDRPEDLDVYESRETVKKVDYIGEKAMSERGKIFPSYKRLKERLNGTDITDFKMFPRDREKISFSVLKDDCFESFEFDMKTGDMDKVGK